MRNAGSPGPQVTTPAVLSMLPAMLGFSIVKVFIWGFWREGGMLFAAAVILCAVSVSGESKRSVSDPSTVHAEGNCV